MRIKTNIIDNIDELSGKFDTEQAELTKAEDNGFFQLWKAVELLAIHIEKIEKQLEQMGHNY